MKLSQPLLWLLILLWFILGAWWYTTSSCHNCNTASAGTNVTPAAPTVAATAPGLAVNDADWGLSNPDDNLRFGKSAAVPVLSDAVSKTIDGVAEHAKLPSKKVVVTGYYTEAEKNSTTFDNLGLARADALKKLLVAKGAPEASVTTASSVVGDLYFTPADTLIGGASFAFSDVAAPVAAAPKAEEVALFEPRTVYFNTAENSLPVNKALAAYLLKASAYLKANPSKKLMVTGYTDNVGEEQKNIALSAARAEFVKNQLAKRGLPIAQMETAGKGMADPVADNATADGRAKNRRVTIVLQ